MRALYGVASTCTYERKIILATRLLIKRESISRYYEKKSIKRNLFSERQSSFQPTLFSVDDFGVEGG